MKTICANCAYFDRCGKPKDKICTDFIFKSRSTDKPVKVKVNRIKKG